VERNLPVFGFEVEGSCCFGSATALVRYFSSPTNAIAGTSLRVMQRLLEFIHSPQNTANNEAFFAISAISKGVVVPREMYGGTRLKVLGIGALGRSVLEELAPRELPIDLLYWPVRDGDRSADPKVRALSAAGQEQGAKTAPDLASEIEHADFLVVVADLGEPFSVEASRRAATAAKRGGVLSLCFIAQPFTWARSRRAERAANELVELTDFFDSLVSVPTDAVWRMAGKSAASAAIAYSQKWIADAVAGIGQIINVPGHVNVDFEDIAVVLREGGRTIIGVGTASGPDRARIAAEEAASSPAAVGADLQSAKGVLVLITAAKGSLKLSESKLAMNTVRAWCAPTAHVIYGTAYDERLGEAIRLTVFASGVTTDAAAALQPSVWVVEGKASQTSRSGTVTSAHSSILPADHKLPVPSIWRTNNTVVRIAASDDEDEFEIPNMRRKQAD
jgi:cell division protein FtsZ